LELKKEGRNTTMCFRHLHRQAGGFFFVVFHKVGKEDYSKAPSKGYCASQNRYYYGYKLHTICSIKGFVCVIYPHERKKRISPLSKNELMRSMIRRAIKNRHLVFAYVLADSWFSSSDNMLFIHKERKHFLMDMKSNRLCTFGTEDRNKGKWSSLDKLSVKAEHPVKIWLKDLEISVLLCKHVFTDKDGSTGEMYLVTNHLKLRPEEFKTLYKKLLECGRIS
jgi:hypothetical protein